MSGKGKCVWQGPFLPFLCDQLPFRVFSLPSLDSASAAQMKRSRCMSAVTLKGEWAAISNFAATNLCSRGRASMGTVTQL